MVYSRFLLLLNMHASIFGMKLHALSTDEGNSAFLKIQDRGLLMLCISRTCPIVGPLKGRIQCCKYRLKQGTIQAVGRNNF